MREYAYTNYVIKHKYFKNKCFTTLDYDKERKINTKNI